MMSVVVFESRVILEMRCRGSGRTCASRETDWHWQRGCDQRWSWTLWLIKHSLRLAERADRLWAQSGYAGDRKVCRECERRHRHPLALSLFSLQRPPSPSSFLASSSTHSTHISSASPAHPRHRRHRSTPLYWLSPLSRSSPLSPGCVTLYLTLGISSIISRFVTLWIPSATSTPTGTSSNSPLVSPLSATTTSSLSFKSNFPPLSETVQNLTTNPRPMV